MNFEYLTDEALRTEADDFRRKYAPDSKPPIDVIYIAEVDLRLEVIPTPQLFSKIGMDAALASDMRVIYVDEESYLKWESGQHWIEKRLRFSFAHELGPMVLHKELDKEGGFHSIREFKHWAGTPEKYRRAEYQADEFAGRLLVPQHLLASEYDKYQKEAENYDPKWRQIEGIREHIAKKIAPRFGVNHQVIQVRLDREGIWPVSC